jgi:mycothiol synthase
MPSQLQMIYPAARLTTPPVPQLPSGYALRTFRFGDEPRFYEVMASAGWAGWDDERLAHWLVRILPDGWFFAVDVATDTIVATAMAVHSHSELHPFGGELGWVAADSAHTGKGLGMAVTAAVTARLISAGYRNIHLYTEDFRLPAIKTYLKLGYEPFLYAPDMPQRWQSLCEQLHWAYTPDQWRSLY